MIVAGRLECFSVRTQWSCALESLVIASLLFVAHSSSSALLLSTLAVDGLKEKEELWNAAAVSSPKHGWVVFATLTQCFWGGGCSKGDPFLDWTDIDAIPWIAHLGSEHAPELSKFREGARFDYDAESFARISGVNHTNMLNEDFRPFTWDDELLVSFSHRSHQFWPEYQAIAVVDQVQQKLVLQTVFREHGFQKNWGFFQEAERHLILHSALPCTLILEQYGTSNRTLEIFKACYTDPEHAMRNATLLDISTAHNSGHPVLWTKTPGEAPTEYLLMVHNRETYTVGGYNHWLLRMDARTRALTHVSDGVVFGYALSHANGRAGNAVIVGSFNLVTMHGRQHLSVFGGQGDSLCVHEHIDLSRVDWLDVTRVLQSEIVHSEAGAMSI